MAYLLPISHAWLLILCYASAEKKRKKRSGERWRVEGESKRCDGVYLHLGESYRTRDESSMGEAIISSQVCLTARKKKKRREMYLLLSGCVRLKGEQSSGPIRELRAMLFYLPFHSLRWPSESEAALRSEPDRRWWYDGNDDQKKW